MGQIYIKFDNKIKHKEINIPLTNSSVAEAGEDYVYNKEGVQQTSIYGILAPIIMINNIVIDFKDVIQFSLRSINALPQVDFLVTDRYKLTQTIDTPGKDNELTIQILPPFDNAYKKINLSFYITSINIDGETISGSGVYKSPKLLSNQFKCFGKLSTYEIFENVAKELNLGFATNCSDDINDKRYMYCDYKSYQELLNTEISKSYADETIIYDWWIDLWDNINLVNILDRYNTKDKQEDMMIWVSGQPKELIEGVKVVPFKVPAKLNNHPADANTELHVSDYETINKMSSQISGTDVIYSVYEEDIKEHKDHYVADGDPKNDLFYKYEYLGEVYGSYNYLLYEKYRQFFLKKINTEQIKVITKTPLIALMRGQKVDFAWYINDSGYEDKKYVYREQNIIYDTKDVGFNDDLPLDQQEKYNPTNGEFIMDKSVSGQYMISGVDIRFENGEWFYELTLIRPAQDKPVIINEQINKN